MKATAAQRLSTWSIASLVSDRKMAKQPRLAFHPSIRPRGPDSPSIESCRFIVALVGKYGGKDRDQQFRPGTDPKSCVHPF